MSSYSPKKMKESQEFMDRVESIGAKCVGSIMIFRTDDGNLVLAQGYGSALDTYVGLIPEICRRINAPHEPLPPATEDAR